MASKSVKLAALPAMLGFASVRVYAVSEAKTEELLSPQELSVYTPLSHQFRFVEEDPGLLQRGLGVVRVGLQPYVRAIKNACGTVKVGVVNLYNAGQDTYEYLKDPPPGFLPRVSLITVSGLAGLILARKGPRLKRVGVPLGLATVGMAVCYPAQTVGVLKLTGKQAYAATQWASSSVTSLWKPSSAKDVIVPSASPERSPSSPLTRVFWTTASPIQRMLTSTAHAAECQAGAGLGVSAWVHHRRTRSPSHSSVVHWLPLYAAGVSVSNPCAYPGNSSSTCCDFHTPVLSVLSVEVPLAHNQLPRSQTLTSPLTVTTPTPRVSTALGKPS